MRMPEFISVCGYIWIEAIMLRKAWSGSRSRKMGGHIFVRT